MFGPRGCRNPCKSRYQGGCDRASKGALVGVGFRITKKGDHWINDWTAWITAKHGDVIPDGRVSHVEILVEDEGKVLSFSIVKATMRMVDGKMSIDKGKVHCKVINGPQDHYVYYFPKVNGTEKAKLLSFLKSQVGAEFNERGYMLNFFLPGIMTFGARRTRDVEEPHGARMFSVGDGGDPEAGVQYRQDLRWFCSSLVSCGLVTAGVLKDWNFSRATPNSLFQMMRKKFRFQPPCITFPLTFDFEQKPPPSV